MRAMPENQPEIPQSDSKSNRRLTLDKLPIGLAKKSSKAFPDGAKGRKRAIITLMALSLDPELPDEVRRFLTQWGYTAENYPKAIDPRGLYQKLLEAIEEAKQK